MNKNTQSSMLDVETNLLAGLFILLVLVAINAGKGGNFDIDQEIGGGDEYKSNIPYEVYLKRPKDNSIVHVYIELIGRNAQSLKLNLQESGSIDNSCSLSVTPFHSPTTWVATRKKPMLGEWKVEVLNPPIASQTVSVKIHVFFGSVHSCSQQFKLTRTTSDLVLFQENGTDFPTINFGNDESCL